MKKAQQINSKQASKGMEDKHLSLSIRYNYTIASLRPQAQSQAHGMAGSIRLLMATHNALLDSSIGQSQSNRNAIERAASSLDASIDQKIDTLNEFFIAESGAKNAKQKSSPKNSKRSAAMRKAWRKRKAKNAKSKKSKK